MTKTQSQSGYSLLSGINHQRKTLRPEAYERLKRERWLLRIGEFGKRRNAPNALRHLRLPRNLIRLPRQWKLEREIARARRRHELLTAADDAWEASNLDTAKRLPWFEGRQAWKASGRPEPEWYELLWLFDRVSVSRWLGDASTNLLFRCKTSGRHGAANES